MVNPSDIDLRERFANELDHNFSVVASAGSGKTTAITQRVLSIARSAKATEILPRLVVVTYANRAADEMQLRTRQILLADNLRADVQTAFNRAFFGTIHSFCMKLLTDYGHYLGLPAPLELLADDDDLWREFVQGQTRIGHSLGPENRKKLLRLVQARDLMELARRAGTETLSAPELSPCPPLDFADVYAETDRRDSDTISKSQTELRDWERRYAGDWEFLRWPVCFSTATSNFTELWQENSRHCENGFAISRPVSRQKCNGIIASFGSSVVLSLTTIRSRSRKNCFGIRSPVRAFAKKSFV